MTHRLKVLFVCTGNLCRSPMAEALFRAELERRGCDGVDVASAGTWAGYGNPASGGAVAVLQARGLDLSEHRSRPVMPEELDEADIVVVMTSVHVREVLSMREDARRKMFLMKELAELQDAVVDERVGSSSPTAGPSQAAVAALLEARRPPPRRSLDLDDPIGLPLSAYERCVNEVHAGVVALAQRLCPEPS